MTATRWRSALALLREPHLWVGLAVRRDFTAFARIHFVFAASRSGLLEALRTPATRDDLVQSLDVRRPEVLEALLELGLSLGELSRGTDGRYALRGQRSRLVASQDGDAFAALVEEWVLYDADVFRETPARLHGAALGEYLAPTAAIVARSSRVIEPLVGPFVRGIVERRRPSRLLDVGCGSGVYLRHAAAADPGLTGVGLDVQPDAVDLARANLSTWGLAGRFTVALGDARAAKRSFGGGFDLVTLFNSVYYFAPEERVGLFRDLRALLSARGALALVTATRGRDVAVAAFDLVLRSTAGCWPVPERSQLTRQLREAGFGEVQWSRLAPGVLLDAALAT